ncbi:hypothetical protein ACFX1S_030430 [Malus domestica]
MHGFPLEYFFVENARVFSQPFGELLAVEDPFDGPERIKDCLRNDVIRGKTRVVFNFECRSNFCFRCGKLGHLDSTVLLRHGSTYAMDAESVKVLNSLCRCVVHALALQTDGSSLELQLSTTGAIPIVKLAQQPPSHLSNNMPQNI